MQQFLGIADGEQLTRVLAGLVERIARGIEIEFQQLLGAGDARLCVGERGFQSGFLPGCQLLGGLAILGLGERIWMLSDQNVMMLR